MGKKPIVPVTYENKKILIKKKKSFPYLKCVLGLSCVVHWQIYMTTHKSARRSHRDVTHILFTLFFIQILSFS